MGQLLYIPNGRNKCVSQMHVPQVAFHKPAGVQNRPPNVLYVFEYKT